MARLLGRELIHKKYPIGIDGYRQAFAASNCHEYTGSSLTMARFFNLNERYKIKIDKKFQFQEIFSFITLAGLPATKV